MEEEGKEGERKGAGGTAGRRITGSSSFLACSEEGVSAHMERVETQLPGGVGQELGHSPTLDVSSFVQAQASTCASGRRACGVLSAFCMASQDTRAHAHAHMKARIAVRPERHSDLFCASQLCPKKNPPRDLPD